MFLKRFRFFLSSKESSVFFLESNPIRISKKWRTAFFIQEKKDDYVL